MAKRKRQPAAANGENPTDDNPTKRPKAAAAATANGSDASSPETIQIVVGSYDRILHGLTATIRSPKQRDGKKKKTEQKKTQGKAEEAEGVEFADTFLFNAHTSAIRCVAVSPPSAAVPGQAQKILLASGSSDERINVYSLSAHAPSRQRRGSEALTAVAPRPILEDRRNRELGTLLHHASAVTALSFPTRSKLLSSSEDSTLAVTRTRDWSLLSTIKAPAPRALGRPSGDTAPLGAAPCGVNDFAVHPSMKLMVSVSRGERCMRLWNLVTGKRAGVLNFSRGLLREVGEAKHSTGEGRRVVWGSADGADEFAVGFDRDVVVFGMDSVPRCRLMPAGARTKVHHFSYVAVGGESGPSLLAVATEDGRVLFFSTREADITRPEEPAESSTEPPLGVAKLVAHVGRAGPGAPPPGRIKDFVALASARDPRTLHLVAGSSDGQVRVWSLAADELEAALGAKGEEAPAVGRLLGTYETQNRITCVAAFAMIPLPEGVEEEEEEEGDEDDEDAEDSD